MTTTRASNVRLSRKKIRGNDNPKERADRFSAAAGAGAPDAAGSDGSVFVTADCVRTTAPLGASEGPVRGAVGALAAGAAGGLGKVESMAAEIGAGEAEVPAFRLDCALLLPSCLSLCSPSRASGTMSAGSYLRNSFIFSGESRSCANAPAAESNSVKTMTRMVFCVLKCVKSFHLSHLQENRRDQPNQCD